MNRMVHRVRTPVRRDGAGGYILITLLSFAATVSLTRLFLELTGYPQVGNSTLHIAHVLYGGLLLFVAAILPLIFANRWAYTAGAILAGIGVGLFIDEVGKFITQTNDYFFAPAAPIVYAFFLLVVLLYLQVRRPPSDDVRSELYYALDGLQEVLDHDLEPGEEAVLSARLERIAARSDAPESARLAKELLEFLHSGKLKLVPEEPDLSERISGALEAFEARWIGKGRLQAALAGGLIALGLLSGLAVIELLFPAVGLARVERTLQTLVEAGRIAPGGSLEWFAGWMALDGSIGLILLVAGVLMIVGRERFAVGLGMLGLLLSLTTVDLVVFYFQQFRTIITAAVQFGLFLTLGHYRRSYLRASDERTDQADMKPA
jgi:hypothetical protein